MTRERLPIKPCPDGIANHGAVSIDDPTADGLELPRGTLLHIDRRKRPGNGDLVVAEMDLGGRLTRTIRRFTLADGIVSLARVDGQANSVVRPRHEVGVLGVVDGHLKPLSPIVSALAFKEPAIDV